MSGSFPTERLVRFLQATPEQLELIARILDAKAPLAAKPGTVAAVVVPAEAAPPPVLPPAEPFIGKPEAAQRLGIKPRTLDQWLHDGRIPFYRVGRSCRLRWSEVQAHLAETARVARRSGRRSAR